MGKDYYSILEIQKSATDADIKNAYRRLARLWHPDKNPHRREEADTKFKEIAEAYQVLSNKRGRYAYDNRFTEPNTASYTYQFKPQEYTFRSADDLFKEFCGFNSEEEAINEIITDPDLRREAGLAPRTFSNDVIHNQPTGDSGRSYQTSGGHGASSSGSREFQSPEHPYNSSDSGCSCCCCA